MPKIAFLGISERPIRVKATQAEATTEATIGDVTGGIDKGDENLAPASGDVDIDVNRRAGTAPAGFFFSAREMEDALFDRGGDPDFDPYYDLHFKWSFSDSGWYTRHDTEDLPWDRVYRVHENAQDTVGKVRIVRGPDVYAEDGQTFVESAVLESGIGFRPRSGITMTFLGADRDIAYGPHVCHVFAPTPEDFAREKQRTNNDFITYVVKCEVQRRGEEPLVKEIQVAVDNPDIKFAGKNTICISLSGNFEGAPERAQQVRTYAEALTLAEAAGSELRILFRRGENHDCPWTAGMPVRKSGFQSLQIGAFGSGTDLAQYGPQRWMTSTNGPAGSEFSIWGMRYIGPYDPTDPWGSSGTGSSAIETGNATFHTIWDCRLSNMKTGISGSTDVQNLIVGNTHIHDWFNYGSFWNRGAGNSGFCGCWIKQNPRTVIGEGKSEDKPPYYADHGPWRCSATNGAVAFNLCDLRSANSWAGYYQPVIRALRTPYDGQNIVIEEGVIDRVRGENGNLLMTAAASGPQIARRYLFDKCYSVQANQAGEFASVFGTPAPGMRFRNCIAVLPDQPRVGGGQLRYWLRKSGDFGNVHESVGQLGVDVYSSTLVDLRAPGNAWGMDLVDEESVANFKYVQFANNIFWVPDPARQDATTKDGPLDLTEMWSVTNPGVKWENDPFEEIYAYAPGTAACYMPRSDSPAYTSAKVALTAKQTLERVAADDFFGRPRTLTAASRGAIESS